MEKPMETQLENLGNNTFLCVSKEHTFGTDAIALAYFSAPKRNTVACDLGSGCGIIPMIFCRDGLCRKITAVEIQKNACEQIEKAVEINGLSEKFNVINHDLRTLTDNEIPLYSFDLVTMNPPYKAPGAGKTNVDESALIARHEVMCVLDDVTKTAAKLLKFGGRLCVCHRPERLADVICSMRENGIEPKRVQLLVHSVGKSANLIMVEGKKGASSGMVIEPDMILKNEDGTYTEKALLMYGAYR